MVGRVVVLLSAVLLLAGSLGCERLPDGKQAAGTLRLEDVKLTDSIPAEYGELVAVTSSAAYPGWAQLWFKRADTSIATVFVDFQSGRVRDKVLVIPRS